MLKAYAVQETSENTCAIVFAASNIEARKRGAGEFNDGELGGLTCERAPWADGYAETGIPAHVMIAHGWWFECRGCGETISQDWLDDADLPIEGVIGTQPGRIFCCEICEARQKLHDAIRRDYERRMLAELEAFVLKRFPAAAIHRDGNNAPHAYAAEQDGCWHVPEAVVSFDFPGQAIAPAQCRIDRYRNHHRLIGPVRPEFSCCAGDREAFEVWAASSASRAQAAMP